MFSNKDITKLTACLLDRPRHNELIRELNKLNVNLKLITDGDVSGALGASDVFDTVQIIFRNRDVVFDQGEGEELVTGVKEIYQREIIDIAVRKMTGNIESANIQYQQIEAEQSKSI